MDYALVKTIHIVSSTVLFGTGIGTAFHMWFAHRRGDARAIAVVARNVVLADWLFTTPAGLVQPASGVGLIVMNGIDPWSPWLIAAYGLYALAGACWLPVVWIQIEVARMAAALGPGDPLPARHHRLMRIWFALGWPAFIALAVVFWLMVAKPTLW